MKTVQQLVHIYRDNCPPDGRPLALKAHGVAFAGPDPAVLRTLLPVSASEVPKYLNLVCLNEVRDRADMEQRLHGVAAVKVRGPVVHAWSHFVAHTNRGIGLNQAALQEYGAAVYQQPGGCVPLPVLDSAVATQRADVAAVMQSTFLHDRAGNAAVRQGEDEVVAARRVQEQEGQRSAEAAQPDAATRPFVGLVQQPRQEAAPAAVAASDGSDGVLDELELVIPQAPPPVQPGSAHSNPDTVLELLTKGIVVHCAGGPRASILREDSPRILSDAFPTALPYAWGGQRPVCMSLPAYFRHLNARVPRRQFSGNANFLVRVADMQVKHEIRTSTAITARMAPEVVQQAGTLPRDFARQLADLLAMPSYDDRRQRVMDQGGGILRSFLAGAEKIAGRVDMTDSYYRGAQQQLRCASFQLGLPMLWWNINPSDMYADAVIVASGEVSNGYWGKEGRDGERGGTCVQREGAGCRGGDAHASYG